MAEHTQNYENSNITNLSSRFKICNFLFTVMFAGLDCRPSASSLSELSCTNPKLNAVIRQVQWRTQFESNYTLTHTHILTQYIYLCTSLMPAITMLHSAGQFQLSYAFVPISKQCRQICDCNKINECSFCCCTMYLPFAWITVMSTTIIS